MPNESVGNKSFRDLFNQNVSFVIPFFQRGYAWEKKQWDALLQDIEEQILNEADEIGDIKNYELFFGSIVVAEMDNSTDGFKKYTVIDGQQRITTVYLLLSIIKEMFRKKSSQSQDAVSHINELTNLIQNKNVNPGEYERMKVYSSKGDRLPTYKTVFNDEPKNILYSDIQLYRKGENNIDKLKEYCDKILKDEKYNSVPSLWRLCLALLDSLKVVWIPLKSSDDQQAIFESLNDKGMPLSAAELLCNYIFRPIIVGNEDYEKLHNEKWLFTQKNIEGGLRGFEQYLRLLFSIGNKKLIGKGRTVYTFFKNSNKGLTSLKSKNIINSIFSYYPDYNFVVNPAEYPHGIGAINHLMEKINSTRMEGAYTFLLSVLKAFKENELTQNEVTELFQETLVLMVRRKYGELRTTKYDTIFPGMLGKLLGETHKIQRFQQIIRSEEYWVSDDEFSEWIVEKPLYRSKDLPFTNLILQDVDRKMQNFDQYPDYTTLNTVEHILPQTLDKGWEAYLGTEFNNEDLKRYTDTIGNLTLLSQPANSHAGQDPFLSKIEDYTLITALNRDIEKRKDKHWNIAAIKERSILFREKLLNIYAWKR
jgi:uncharacterized protein with ParB-like and HNH nuclease domain